MIELEGDGVYRKHRIHTSELFSGVWVASVVHLGAQGSGVEAVPGEYQTHEAAVEAAKRHIEQEEEQLRQK
ncbi:MAG TPA: hypothetical protein VLM91_21640 [Candidatus Methylomirabilis sp.]|nr:hypothetical protein [Candidatus Methylomirabilis sp.]